MSDLFVSLHLSESCSQIEASFVRLTAFETITVGQVVVMARRGHGWAYAIETLFENFQRYHYPDACFAALGKLGAA